MLVRDAFSAGTSELINPIAPAVRTHANATGSSKGWNAGRNPPNGLLATIRISSVEMRYPMVPPAIEMAQASPRIMPSMLDGVKPSVLRIPTSRTRSRTDMAMVLAETNKIVNITAAEMPIRNILMLPNNARKATANAWADSVLVCAVELANRASIALAMRAELAGLSIRM